MCRLGPRRGSSRFLPSLAFPPLAVVGAAGGSVAMRMLVLGPGVQGSACAYDLLQQREVERVTLAPPRPERLPAFLRPLVGPRLAVVKLAGHAGPRLRWPLHRHDAVLRA